jgi:hypothetical protein
MSTLREIIKSFGKESNSSYVLFVIHSLFLSSVGFILGGLVEYLTLQYEKYDTKYSFWVQLSLNINIFWLLSKYFFSFSSEFQKTYSGLIFVALYFGVQTNLINRLNTTVKKS